MSESSSKAMLWAGRVLSAVPSLGLTMSAAMKLSQSEEFMAQWAHFGYPAAAARPVGAAELLGVVLYLFPKTSVLGLVWLTGYLGGAIATHVHAGEGFAAPAIVALMLWGGLYLREPRLRALLPLRW